MGRVHLERLGERAMDRLDLPADLAAVPHMELVGSGQFFMARHRGVLSYSTEQVDISAGSLVVRVTGRELQLQAMTEEELRLGGTVEKVELVEI